MTTPPLPQLTAHMDALHVEVHGDPERQVDGLKTRQARTETHLSGVERRMDRRIDRIERKLDRWAWFGLGLSVNILLVVTQPGGWGGMIAQWLAGNGP